MTTTLALRLDGKQIPFLKGQTIMDAALAAGEYIPYLCHSPGLEPHGSCRLCLVGLNGDQVCACTTPAEEGMEIDSNSADIRKARLTILQMLFVEGDHTCPGCELSGACRLQALGSELGMLTPRFPQFSPNRELDASHPDFVIDFNRCILCELCVRASRDLDGKEIFAVSGRGLASKLIIDSPSGMLGDTSFSSEDQAASICPVGAILPKHRGYATPIGERLFDRTSISGKTEPAGNGQT